MGTGLRRRPAEIFLLSVRQGKPAGRRVAAGTAETRRRCGHAGLAAQLRVGS